MATHLTRIYTTCWISSAKHVSGNLLLAIPRVVALLRAPHWHSNLPQSGGGFSPFLHPTPTGYNANSPTVVSVAYVPPLHIQIYV